MTIDKQPGNQIPYLLTMAGRLANLPSSEALQREYGSPARHFLEERRSWLQVKRVSVATPDAPPQSRVRFP